MNQLSFKRTTRVTLCGALLLCSACCSLLDDDDDTPSTPPPVTVQPTPPVKSVPSAPQPGPQTGQPGGGSKQVVISPGGGLPGGMQVTTGGQSVWPPQGPGCDQLVACCQAAAAVASDISLFCQMSVATQPVNCPAALQSVRSYLGERGLTPPPQCAQ